MTEAELKITALLAEAFNEFYKLPVQHPSDLKEMQGAIHDAQKLVMIRATRRAYPDVFPIYTSMEELGRGSGL